jgi:peptide/nickel transport system permease protein
MASEFALEHAGPLEPGRRGTLQRLGRSLRSSSKLTIGAVVIVALVAVAVLAPLLAPHDPLAIAGRPRLDPSMRFPFGTDELGRDELSRIIYGARISLWVGIVAVGVALVSGTLLGVVAGHFRGAWDAGIMRLMDILFAFPTILLAIALVAMLGPSLTNVMIAVGVVGLPSYARLSRAGVLAVEQQPYVEAAHAVGASHARIIFTAILPNIMALLIVQASLSLGGAIIAESSLSYLGLGDPPPSPSWGGMLTRGRGFMELHPLLVLCPILAIMVTVLAFNILGDGLRDSMDPRLRSR